MALLYLFGVLALLGVIWVVLRGGRKDIEEMPLPSGRPRPSHTGAKEKKKERPELKTPTDDEEA